MQPQYVIITGWFNNGYQLIGNPNTCKPFTKLDDAIEYALSIGVDATCVIQIQFLI